MAPMDFRPIEKYYRVQSGSIGSATGAAAAVIVANSAFKYGRQKSSAGE